LRRRTNSVSMWLDSRPYKDNSPWDYYEAKTNSFGNVTEVLIRAGDGRITEHYYFKYDRKKRLIKKITHRYFEDYPDPKVTTEERNTHPDLLRQRALNKGLHPTSWVEYSYDRRGNLILEKTVSNRDSTLKMIKRHFYNARHQKIKTTDSSLFYDSVQYQATVSYFKYDAKGRLIEEHIDYNFYNRPYRHFWHTVYSYSIDDRLLAKTFQDERRTQKYQFEYDSRGNLTAELRWWNDKPWKTIRYSYGYR
ncbi:MAG TPA: hypothetical protein VFO76_00850, partial [Candidatus Kapabacteria bacterium]|nr:hypothetical protein [Candidatus Kapabacteria bacterium]